MAFILFGHVLLSPSNQDHFFTSPRPKTPYLTNAEENEFKRLKTTTDGRILGNEELFAAKGTRSFSIGYWVGEGVVGFCFNFTYFLKP